MVFIFTAGGNLFNNQANANNNNNGAQQRQVSPMRLISVAILIFSFYSLLSGLQEPDASYYSSYQHHHHHHHTHDASSSTDRSYSSPNHPMWSDSYQEHAYQAEDSYLYQQQQQQIPLPRIYPFATYTQQSSSQHHQEDPTAPQKDQPAHISRKEEDFKAMWKTQWAIEHDSQVDPLYSTQIHTEAGDQQKEHHLPSLPHQIKTLSNSLHTVFNFKRRWSRDATRLKYHKGNQCISKIRRHLMGSRDSSLQQQQHDSVSIQQVHIVCFSNKEALRNAHDHQDAPFTPKHSQMDSVKILELKLPPFHGLDLIEDVGFFDEDLNLDRLFDDGDTEESSFAAQSEESASQFCLHLLVRNDAHAYRSYCLNQKYLSQYVTLVKYPLTYLSTMGEEGSDSGNNHPPMHELLLKSTESSKPKTASSSTSPSWSVETGPLRRESSTTPLFLSNPIGLVTYRNGTTPFIMVLSQHIKKDALRSQFLDSDTSDIDVTSYNLMHHQNNKENESPPQDDANQPRDDAPNSDDSIISHGYIGVPPFLQYFLSGNMRDDVYQLQPLLMCSPNQKNCLFSFLFGLYLSIQLPRDETDSFGMHVVDYRHHFPHLHLETIFTQKIIFNRGWLPPVMRLTDDGSKVALVDVQQQRVLLFAHNAEQEFDISAELYENSQLQTSSFSEESDGHFKRDAVLDAQFVRLSSHTDDSSVVGTITFLQVMYRGSQGRYTKFYPLNVEEFSLWWSLLQEFSQFFDSNWKLLMTLSVLTIGFIINEITLWRQFLQRHGRRPHRRQNSSDDEDIANISSQDT